MLYPPVILASKNFNCLCLLVFKWWQNLLKDFEITGNSAHDFIAGETVNK